MAETETKLEKEFRISEYLSFGGPFIIFLGMTRLMTFYSAFGVSIVSYLDFSEIITSFFDILYIVVYYIAYISIQNFILANNSQAEKSNVKRRDIINENNFLKLIPLYLSYLRPILIFGLIVFLGSLILHYAFNLITELQGLILGSIFYAVIFYLIIIVEIERKHIQLESTVNRKRFILFTFYFLVFTVGVNQYSSFQARLIKSDKSTCGVTITLNNDQTFVSDSTSYYIGKTLNYVFIYHEKQNSTDIIPMSRVKQITMKLNK